MGNLLQSVKQNPVLWIWNLPSYDNFLVYAMTFFRVIHVQGSHAHHALWTGGGVLFDYIRQPCKGQGFFVPLVSKRV